MPGLFLTSNGLGTAVVLDVAADRGIEGDAWVSCTSVSANERVTSTSDASAVKRALGFETRTVAREWSSPTKDRTSLAISDARDSTVRYLDSSTN